jgi:hypothetical protein
MPSDREYLVGAVPSFCDDTVVEFYQSVTTPEGYTKQELVKRRWHMGTRTAYDQTREAIAAGKYSKVIVRAVR